MYNVVVRYFDGVSDGVNRAPIRRHKFTVVDLVELDMMIPNIPPSTIQSIRIAPAPVNGYPPRSMTTQENVILDNHEDPSVPEEEE